MPCNNTPSLAAPSQRFEVSNPDRIKVPLALLCCCGRSTDGFEMHYIGWLVVLCRRKSCPQPVLLSWITGLEKCAQKIDQNPSVSFCFWAVLNG